MISATLFTLTAAMLFVIVRYRVHIHVTYESPASRPQKAARPAAGRRTVQTNQMITDLRSALINAGASKAKADRAAAEAAQHPGTFEERLRLAFQLCTRKESTAIA